MTKYYFRLVQIFLFASVVTLAWASLPPEAQPQKTANEIVTARLFNAPDPQAVENVAPVQTSGQELTEAVPELFGQTVHFGSIEKMDQSLWLLLQMSPAFAPVEDLPEELWKNRPCTDCHKWTAEALCTQAERYTTADTDRYTRHPHPFGGGLRASLGQWAQAGCR